MLALQNGELVAFDQLFLKHGPAAVAFATHMVGSRARAEEIAQEVFLQVYRNRASYEPKAKFVTWLYRMVTNACVSEVRRSEHRHRAQPVLPADGSEPDAFEIATASTEDDVAERDGIRRIRGALDALPEQQRAALLLARVEGFSYDEVAESLSTSVAAVKSLIHRATTNMRNRFPDREV